MQLGKGKRAWKYVWAIPITYAVLAGIEAAMAGSVVGAMYVYLETCLDGFLLSSTSAQLLSLRQLLLIDFSLGAVYNAGYFRMSTWIPLIWSLINVLVLILSSFSIQGGL